MSSYILAIDQGTSATKCILVNAQGGIVAKASASLSEYYPQPGWVEQDANEIWGSVQKAVADCLLQIPDATILAVGLSVQRESALIWNKADGQAITPLLSWQDQRTWALRDQLSTPDIEVDVRKRSGLPLDPMFSALKLSWLLNEIDPDRLKSSSEEWCMGTVDAYLIARMGGAHMIEVGNASRTQLLNVSTADWDTELLRLFNIPRQALPKVVPSIGEFADAKAIHPRLTGVPVRAVMADSHSALFAHGGYEPGMVKATTGTGASVMGLTDGRKKVHDGLCLTIAWDDGRGPKQALEGNIRAAGSTLLWAAKLFGLTVEEAVANIATQTQVNEVCLVPGFNGLGAPWWDSRATGLLTGMTLNTDKDAILAAALDSIAHQIADVLDAMDESFEGIHQLMMDGGPSRNSRLRETISSYIDRPVVYCNDPELSALGVAHLAGLGAGFWQWADLEKLPRAQQKTDVSQRSIDIRLARQNWARAVAQARYR